MTPERIRRARAAFGANRIIADKMQTATALRVADPGLAEAHGNFVKGLMWWVSSQIPERASVLRAQAVGCPAQAVAQRGNFLSHRCDVAGVGYAIEIDLDVRQGPLGPGGGHQPRHL